MKKQRLRKIYIKINRYSKETKEEMPETCRHETRKRSEMIEREVDA